MNSDNDGELSKINFTDYVRDRIAGFESRPRADGRYRRLSITARDETKVAGYFEANPRARFPGGSVQPVCIDKLRYVGHDALRVDIANFTGGLKGVDCAEAFLPANT